MKGLPHLPPSVNVPTPVIYRPKYRTRTTVDGYVLEGIAPPETEQKGLFEAVDALEAWQKEDEDAEARKGVRWHPSVMTDLTIAIEPPPRKGWDTLILRACQDWEAASGGTIHFRLAPWSEGANIQVAWTDEATLGRDFETGHTDRTLRSSRWIGQSTITLLASPVIDRHLSGDRIDRRLYATALHEVGHALGLEHSTDARDVMHHRGWRNARVGAGDVRRLQALYQAPSTQGWSY